MAERLSNAVFPQAAKQKLAITSDQWGLLGPTFRMEIPVTPREDGLYEIAKTDWDATIGPLFDRLRHNLLHKNPLSREMEAVAVGYGCMAPGETQAFHKLMQGFAAAADPSSLSIYPGTAETNPHLAALTAFAERLNGPSQSVLVSKTQLQALASVARGALEHLHEGRDLPESTRDFYEGFLKTEGVRYRNGWINAIT